MGNWVYKNDNKHRQVAGPALAPTSLCNIVHCSCKIISGQDPSLHFCYYIGASNKASTMPTVCQRLSDVIMATACLLTLVRRWPNVVCRHSPTSMRSIFLMLTRCWPKRCLPTFADLNEIDIFITLARCRPNVVCRRSPTSMRSIFFNIGLMLAQRCLPTFADLNEINIF